MQVVQQLLRPVSNIAGRAWSGYVSALKARPILVNTVSGAFVTFAGDIIAQKITIHDNMERLEEARPAGAAAEPAGPASAGHGAPLLEWDPLRTLGLAVWGATGGPMTYWFRYLDKQPIDAYRSVMQRVAPASLARCIVPGGVGAAALKGGHYAGAVVWKVLVHQVAAVPVLNTLFFGWITAFAFSLRGHEVWRARRDAEVAAAGAAATRAGAGAEESREPSAMERHLHHLGAVLSPSQVHYTSPPAAYGIGIAEGVGRAGIEGPWALASEYLHHPSAALKVAPGDVEATAFDAVASASGAPTTSSTAPPAYPIMDEFLSTWAVRARTDAVSVSIRSFFVLGPPQIINQYYVPGDFRVRRLQP